MALPLFLVIQPCIRLYHFRSDAKCAITFCITIGYGVSQLIQPSFLIQLFVSALIHLKYLDINILNIILYQKMK